LCLHPALPKKTHDHKGAVGGKKRAPLSDKQFVSFFDDAQRIFDTAELGEGAAALAILVDDRGSLRIVDSAGWRPEALQSEYGARTVFQVTRNQSGVRVAARSGARSCTLETSVLGPFDHVGHARGLLDLPGHSLL
jgi:hypothetical protein